MTDPRFERTKLHSLVDMVAIAMCAAICGAEGWADVERFGRMKREWFAQFLELPGGIPSHGTFGRVFSRLDTEEFLAGLHRWVRQLNHSLNDQGTAFDAQPLRHSCDAVPGKSARHVDSSWGQRLANRPGGGGGGQKAQRDHDGPQATETAGTDGAVVTLDAMHCQKEMSRVIRAKPRNAIIHQ